MFSKLNRFIQGILAVVAVAGVVGLGAWQSGVANAGLTSTSTAAPIVVNANRSAGPFSVVAGGTASFLLTNPNSYLAGTVIHISCAWNSNSVTTPGNYTAYLENMGSTATFTHGTTAGQLAIEGRTTDSVTGAAGGFTDTFKLLTPGSLTLGLSLHSNTTAVFSIAEVNCSTYTLGNVL